MITILAAIVLALSLISIIPASAYVGLILVFLVLALISTLVRIARKEGPF
jgi:hypothetical protein